MPPSSLATLAPSFAAQPPPAFLLVPLPPAPVLPPWHAILVRYGQEIAAAARVRRDLDLEALCPTFTATWVHRGRSRSLVYPCVRSYVLARWDAADPHLWHALADLPMVLGFLGGPRPAPIPDRDVTLLLARVADVRLTPADARRPRPPLASRVRVTAGPFAGHSGVVARAPSSAPFVAVEISGVLSRDVVVEVPINYCELISPDPRREAGEPGVSRSRRRRIRVRRLLEARLNAD